MKKLLVSLAVGLISQTVFADEFSFICEKEQIKATLELSLNSGFSEYTMNECSGGIDSDFTNCHDVTYKYENKTATVILDDKIIHFEVARSLNSNHHFNGSGKDVHLQNTFRYVVTLKIADKWISLPCNN